MVIRERYLNKNNYKNSNSTKKILIKEEHSLLNKLQ